MINTQVPNLTASYVLCILVTCDFCVRCWGLRLGATGSRSASPQVAAL
jgi:hypothetical protein